MVSHQQRMVSGLCVADVLAHIFLFAARGFGSVRLGSNEILKAKSLEKAHVDKTDAEQVDAIGSEETLDTSQNEEILEARSENVDKNIGEMEQKFEDLLRVVKEETLQLSEFLIEEKRLIHELFVLLKFTLRQLNASFHISAKMIPVSEKVKQVFLNEEGHLILIDDKGGVTSKALEDYPPEVILNVLWVVLPELSEMIVGYRKRISFRVNIFEKISREFRNLHKIFTKHQEDQALEESEAAAQEEAPKDGVRNSLLSKK